MLSVNLGPLSFSIGQLLLVLAFFVALLVGALVGLRYKTPVAGKLLDIFLITLVSARLGFVVRYFEQYQGELLGMLDIRDGGFDVVSGLAGALAATGYLLWRRTRLRRPLGFAVVAGMITWGSTMGLITLIENQAREMPATVLTDQDGQSVRLNQVASGRPRVVNIWATWCPPCIREMPVLEAAQGRYPEVAFIFVNQGEHQDTIAEFLRQQSLELEHVLSDPAGSVARAAGSHGLPTTLFYNAEGRLVDTHIGELSRATLQRGLDRFSRE